MTGHRENFAGWRDEIEIRVGTLEVTQEAEVRARASMDEDIRSLTVELKVQKKLLQALRETQSEHTATLREHTILLVEHSATLREHTVILNNHTERLERLEVGVAKLETGMATVQAGVQTIIGLLDREIDDSTE
jgi:chromosome segregation ATPase